MKGKLVYVVNDYSFLISHRTYLVRRAIEDGWNVVVVTPEKTYFPVKEDIHVRRIHWNLSRKGRNPFVEIGALWRLYRILRSERADVVHAITIKPVIYSGLLSHFLKFRLVASISGLGFTHLTTGISALTKPIVHGLYRLALRIRTTAVIFQNTEDRDLFVTSRRIASSQAFLIPGVGVDTDAHLRSERNTDQPPLFLLPARLLYAKGIKEFYTAAARLILDFPGTRFVVAGSLDAGNPQGIPESVIKNWSETGVIEWWGYRTDMNRAYSEASVVVLPSYREGFSKVLMEAAAAGRPIITTRVPGCQEAVEEGKNGLLVPPRDPDALYDAMRYFLSRPDEIERMGNHSRRLAVERFDREALTKPVLDLYSPTL